MDPLPHVDEHRLRISASSEAIWVALLGVLRRDLGGGAPLARALGCDPAQGTADFAGRPGDCLPGFRVAEAEPGRRLVLHGRHRFARYALTFVVHAGQLRARTDAAFPGVLGAIYRSAVIGSGGHRLVTRCLLRRVARAV
jgi:hypothetical protein